MDNYFDASYTRIDIPARISPQLLESIQKKCSNCIKEMDSDYVLDMQKVANLYSATLALIMHIYKLVCLMKGSLSMVNVNENVARALMSLRIDEKIPHYESLWDYELEKAGARAMSA